MSRPRATDSAIARWRALSPGGRTLLGLGLVVLVWQLVLVALRASGDADLSAKSVTLLSGEATTLAALADGEPLVVNLWATWCPPCRREMPLLAAAQQREANVRFVFANQAETRSTVERYLSESGLMLEHVTLDRYGELGRVAATGMLPATLFYDARGRLVDSHLGELSATTLEQRLARLRTR